MFVFPIAVQAQTCCRFRNLDDGTVCLVFRQNGIVRRDLSVVTAPERDQYALIDSFVSGGSFREYLTDCMARFQGRVCLYLRPQAYRFSLPCRDGQGEPIALCDAETEFCYSEALCCLWRVVPWPAPRVELSDCSRSLREKYRVADLLSVPLLIAEQAVLDIVKAPCEQGA